VRRSALEQLGPVADAPPRTPGLYEELGPYVRGIVRRSLGSDWREHDLVQEVFCRVVNNRHQLRDDRQLKAWVRAITFNVICSELRERRLHREASQDLAENFTANLEHAVMARDFLAQLRARIDRLPHSERTAFVLFFVEQRSVAEIADLEGYSLATAQRRLRRARRILRNFAAQNPTISHRPWRSALRKAERDVPPG
jgi:RNA polymerase sigma factor (sigma-70 family)